MNNKTEITDDLIQEIFLLLKDFETNKENNPEIKNILDKHKSPKIISNLKNQFMDDTEIEIKEYLNTRRIPITRKIPKHSFVSVNDYSFRALKPFYWIYKSKATSVGEIWECSMVSMNNVDLLSAEGILKDFATIELVKSLHNIWGDATHPKNESIRLYIEKQ